MNEFRPKQMLVVSAMVAIAMTLTSLWNALQPEQVGRSRWVSTPYTESVLPGAARPAHVEPEVRKARSTDQSSTHARLALPIMTPSTPALDLQSHLRVLAQQPSERQMLVAYQALADCATRIADWPVQSMAMTERERASEQGRARVALVQRCADVPLEVMVRKASELRATLTARQTPAILAENLADRYRGGVDADAIALADRLRQQADGMTLEALKAFYDVVNRQDPRLDEVIAYRYRPALEAAWLAVWCDLGKDCGSASREWLELCAQRNLCGIEDVGEYMRQVLPEGEVQRAQHFRQLLHARIAAGQYNAIGLAVDPR